MNRLLILIISSSVLCACIRNSHKSELTQTIDYYYDENGKQQGKKAEYFIMLKTDEAGKETEIKHGLYKEYYESGKLMQEVYYEYGKLEGPAKVYYENGQVAEISNWENDRYQGEYKYYFESGKIQEELKYMNGLLNGTYKTYYDNGNLRKEINYKDDLIWKLVANYDSIGNKLDSLTIINGEGQFNEYYPNGQLAAKSNIIGGLLNGSFEVYNQNGKVRMKTNYLNGRKHGDLKIYHENGRIAQQSSFYNDINIGHEKHYNDKGVLVWEINYKAPPFDKTDSIELNLVKDVSIRGFMKLINSLDPKGMFNGIKNGMEKFYYDNGQLKSESYYKDNMQDSIYREYYQNSEIKFEKMWNADHFGSTFSKKFDKEGRLLDSITN